MTPARDLVIEIVVSNSARCRDQDPPQPQNEIGTPISISQLSYHFTGNTTKLRVLFNQITISEAPLGVAQLSSKGAAGRREGQGGMMHRISRKNKVIPSRGGSIRDIGSSPKIPRSYR